LNVESANNEITKDSIYNDSVNQNIIEQDNITFKENVDFTSIKVLHIENINNNKNDLINNDSTNYIIKPQGILDANLKTEQIENNVKLLSVIQNSPNVTSESSLNSLYTNVLSAFKKCLFWPKKNNFTKKSH